MPSHTIPHLSHFLCLAVILPFSTAITTAPGLPSLSNSDTATTAPYTFASAASCAPPAQQFLTYCCSGDLVFPVATGSPQPQFSTAANLDVGQIRRDVMGREAVSEPNGIGPTHSIHVLPGTQLVSGVTCFGSVATVPAGGGGGSGTATTTGSGSGSGSGSSAAATSTSMSSGAGSSGSSGSGSGTGSTAAASSSPTVSSSTASVASGGSTASTGGAAAFAAMDSGFGFSGMVGGLVGLLIALF